MDNWIDLSSLPRRKDGKISWKDCDHNLVNFGYENVVDSLYIENRINQDYVSVMFHNSLFDVPIISIQRCSLGKLFNKSTPNNYHYKEGQIIQDEWRHLKIISQTRIHYSNGKSSKGYDIQCLICGNSDCISEANLERGDGCSVCSNHKLMVGKNDLSTTNPDIAELLNDYNDGHLYMKTSNVKLDFKCPFCGEVIKGVYLPNVVRFGLSCAKCGVGISYPNKLMYNLLSYIKIPFKKEHVFEWCRFPSYSDPLKISTGRYDFVIEKDKLIIEMDGGFGHGKDPHPNSMYSKEELEYRDYMKDVLAEQYGYDMIRVDCDYGYNNRLDYCKNSIIQSKLSDINDIANVDWLYINKLCITSLNII